MEFRHTFGAALAGSISLLGACSSDPESSLGVLSGAANQQATTAAATTAAAPTMSLPLPPTAAVSSSAPAPTTPWVPQACPAYGTSPTDSTPMIAANEANNYTFTSTLTLQNEVVKAATDLTFDWSGLTTDFLEHSLTPADIKMVLLVLFPFSPEQIAQKMNEDSLAQADATKFAMLYPEGLSRDNLFNAYVDTNKLTVEEILPTFSTAPPDGFDPALFTYTAILQSSKEPTREVRMLKTFKLDPNSTNTTLTIDNSSATLSHWEAKIQQAQVTVMPATTPAMTFDWTPMQTNGLGRPFKGTKIREAFVAYYADKTVPDLEREFLFLEDNATKQWRGPVEAGTSLNLSALQDSSGGAFPGIDDTGTWILGLLCTTCSNPAPWYVTVLKTCTQ
jgi:hypothetical protein